MLSSLMGRIRRSLKSLVLSPFFSVPDPYHHPQISIGRHTYGLTPASIQLFSPGDRVVIGSFCSISRSARFIGGGEHHTTRVSTFPFLTRIFDREPERDLVPDRRIRIGHDVWIGAHAVILSGADVGNGAIIAAGAVVTGSVPDYAVVAGVPAKLIRFRFEEPLRAELARTAWWGWSDDEIRRRVDSFYGDPASFIRGAHGER